MNSAAVGKSPDLTPFVSRLAAGWAADDLAQRHRRFDASVLSADISGFTPLTDRLALRGREGAEQLTLIVSAAFSGPIAAAERYGGDVTSFGGDAIFVIFQGADHGQRACQAAIQMQQSLEQTQRNRSIALSMTIGVDSGSLDAFLVGSELKQLILTGPVISSTLALESDAANGEVLIGPKVLTPRTPIDGRAPAISLYRTPQPAGPTSIAMGTGAAALVPQEMIDQIAAVETIQGEHRMATMGFLLFTGTDERARRDPDRLAVDLTTLIDTVR